MRDAFLVTDDSTCTLLTFATLLPNFRFVEFGEYTVLAFDEDDWYVGIEQDDSILTYYEEDARKEFESLGVDMSAARAFVIRYRNTGNSILEAFRLMVHQPNLQFDNDHGLICPLETLIAMADRAPAWDWTTSADLVD